MGLEFLKEGKILVQIKALNPERVLNILWANNIKILNVKRKDIATYILEIKYEDYEFLRDTVYSLQGKIKVIGSRGFLFFIGRLKKKISLVIGSVMFLGVIFYMSTYIWRVEIKTVKNVSPYEIRQQLYELGIKPGIKKHSIDVKEVEKNIEDANEEILWIRSRIEGSTLKITIEEKVNPPDVMKKKYGNLVAKMDGQVTRIYTYSGRTIVEVGEMVKGGDVVIEGIDGNEQETYQVKPAGVVMANTFYEKRMKVQLEGTAFKRTGKRDSDIYLSIFGKKIYIKKAIKDFKEYDKIEESGKIFNKVVYFERGEVEVDLEKEAAIEKSVDELEKSLLKTLTREAKVVDRMVSTEEDGKGNLFVNVIFVIEQNIVDDNPLEY